MVFEKWNGVPIDNEQIKEWIVQGLKELEKNSTEISYYCTSGDCLVFISRIRYRVYNKPYELHWEDKFQVYVTRIESCSLPKMPMTS